MEIERQRDQSNRINTVLKPIYGGGSNSILIPASNEYPMPHNKDFNHMDIKQIWDRIEIKNGEDIENWERVTDQKQVQYMLLKWQQQHFSQATETPFSIPEWKEQLQDKSVQEALLNGTFPIPKDLPLEAQELLQEMRKKKNNIGEIRSYTTFDDFCSYIKTLVRKNPLHHLVGIRPLQDIVNSWYSIP